MADSVHCQTVPPGVQVLYKNESVELFFEESEKAAGRIDLA